MNDFENALLFKCIAEQGSLVKAAKLLNLNPSAVSKRLYKLENSLQTQLINRTTRRLTLTEAGHYFYDKLTRIEYDWHAAVEETCNLSKDVKGNITIAAPQPLISRFLMPWISEFQLLYPDITFDFLHRQIDELPSLDADISISREIENYDSNKMVLRPFFQYHNQLFASTDYLQQHGDIARLDDLKKHCCLIYETLVPPFKWQFEHRTITLGQTIIANNAEIMISAAKQDMGIIYLPRVILQQELSEKILVPILTEQRSKPFKTCVYFLKSEFVPQKLRMFIDFLSQKNSLNPLA